MPQLLHFLRVDEQTRLSAPVLPTTTTTATTADNIGMDAAARDGEVDPPTAVPEGGRSFFNKSDNVSDTCMFIPVNTSHTPTCSQVIYL